MTAIMTVEKDFDNTTTFQQKQKNIKSLIMQNIEKFNKTKFYAHNHTNQLNGIFYQFQFEKNTIPYKNRIKNLPWS